MGCAPGGLTKIALNKAIDAADSQLNKAEAQVNEQLKSAVNQVDDPVNKVVKDVEGKVDSQTKTALEGFKPTLGTAVNQVKEPVDGALGAFKDKVAFDPGLVKKAAQPPLDEVNKKIQDQKNEVQNNILEQVKAKASDPSFVKSLGLGDDNKEIGKAAQANIKEAVDNIIEPAQRPLIAQVDGLVAQGKTAINTALEVPLEPVKKVEAEINAALKDVEAPVTAVNTQANSALKPILDSIEGLVKAPVLQAAAGAKLPAQKACDAAKEGFEKAAGLAKENGAKGISSAPGASEDVKSVANEQLNFVVNAYRNRVNKNVEKNKELINGKVTKYETSVDDIVGNVKKTPPKAMTETFSSVTKPLDDVKDPVLGPIKNMYKAVDETRGFSFGALEKQRDDLDQFFVDLGLQGEKVIYDSLAANGFKKA